jgi:sugar/nucleoside kinase (ribokinase family)
MTRPDFLVIGHVVKDVVPDGWRLGGTAAYASLQATRLGLRVAVVTSAPGRMDLAALLPGVEVHRVPSRRATSFRNCYQDGHRSQFVLARARSLALTDVPDSWRTAPIVLLGPVCGEVPPEATSLFAHSLLGVAAQGWLRGVDRQQRVTRRGWPESPSWAGVHAVFVSEDDLAGDTSALDRWSAAFPVVAYTQASRGACLHADGRWCHIDAFPEREVDPTGAGDVFAAAFLARLSESGDLALAARFAAAGASISVSREGTLAIAGRQQIEERMAQHPEIVLR